jgi:Cu(I)/Ag(I) efflux system periplasmic protein CusF
LRLAIASILFAASAVAGMACAETPLVDMPPSSFKPNEGVVFAVDRPAREITIRHGELPEIGMPPMTMVFNVADAALLVKVKAGDKVKFRTGLVNDRFTVTKIQRQKQPSTGKDGGLDARKNR